MLSEKALAARRKAAAAYREKNRERIRQYDREWRKAHPDASKKYQEKHWEKIAAQEEAEQKPASVTVTERKI